MILDLLSRHEASIKAAIVHRFDYTVSLHQPHFVSCNCGFRGRFETEDAAILAVLEHFNRARRPDEAQLTLF